MAGASVQETVSPQVLPSTNAFPKLKAHKSLPRRTNRNHSVTSRGPVRPIAFSDDPDSPDPVLLPKSPFEYPVLVNGRDSGLPPTPPSNSAEKQSNASGDKFTHSNGASSLLLSRTSTASTPLNQRSPPTPDITPPGSLNTPPRRNPSRQSSSQAESFQTAREVQWSSDEEGGVDSTANGALKPLGSGAVEAVHSHVPDLGLGLVAFETEDDDTTPTQSRLRISKNPKDVLPNGVANPLDQIPDREGEMIRNVTVRRKRPPPPKPVNTAIEPTVSTGGFSAAGPRPAENRVNQSPHTPNTTSSSKDLDWSPPNRSMVSHLQNSSDSKRTSIHSISSNIVEAVVIATPPQRQRTLRHVGKNMALRSEGGSSPEWSPVSRTNKASLHSNDASKHVIRHKRVSIVARNPLGVLEAPVRRKSPTPAVPLKHHPESLSLRTDAAKSAEISRDSNLRPLGGDNAAVEPIKKPPHTSVDKSNHFVDTTVTISSTEPRTGKSIHDVAPKVKFTDSTKGLVDEKEMTQASQVSLTRSATQKALEAVIPMASVEREAVAPKSIDQLPAEPTSREDLGNAVPENVLRRSSVDISPFRSNALSPRSLVSPPDSFFFRHGSDDSAPEETRRQSFDRSTIGTHEFVRHTLDRTSSHTGEHVMARHLSGQLTPFSQSSDFPESMEVSEATAINIYPHNNHSLLVIQQGAKPMQLARRNTIGSTASHELPSLTVQPSTPPPRTAASASVDSPLKNPRKPPQPPAIKILPATPLEELESPLEQAAKGIRLTRRPTLAQRARRYSDAFVAPIIARTASIRRNVKRAVEPASNQEQEAGKLHPFWHPRAFWDDVRDDVSDSDPELDEGDGEEGVPPLPPGGDTTELGEPQGLTRVLDGFRESGGFLIGNTLGVERQPTNRRRHHVALPTGLTRSASGRVQKKGSRGSLDSDRQSVGRMQKRRKVWKGMGLQVEYVGFKGLQELMREKKAEKRREKLKSSIGNRWTVEGAPQANGTKEV